MPIVFIYKTVGLEGYLVFWVFYMGLHSSFMLSYVSFIATSKGNDIYII